MSSSQGDLAQPRQELVKCVVVGDTAVGKTRLICARACNKRFSLAQLLNTHVPTVWAIDQYRIYKEVLEQSWVIVDGVNVSLRLWDTFGDHDKDRRFAYGRSDVVLLCFSVSNPVSLRNCRAMWYPEIRKFCPNTPILLVGCKNDLRYICKDEDYISYCKERSPLIRQTRERDLVMPGEGRSVAREIGVEYYETSVLSFFGVKELFDNVIRAALISRKQQRFWMTNLKRVKRPLPQVPFCPPEPKLPSATVGTSTLDDDLHSLFQTSILSDVVLASGPVAVAAHRCILGAASSVLHKMIHEGVEGQVTRRSSDSSMVSGTFGDTTAGNFNSDTECLISSDHGVLKSANRIREALKRRSSMQSIPFQTSTTTANRENINPALHSITVEQWDDSNSNCSLKCSSIDTCSGSRASSLKLPMRSSNQSSSSSQILITLTKLISPGALRPLIHFMYTGEIVCPKCQLAVPDLHELKQSAELLEVSELVSFTNNVIRKEEFLNGSLTVEYLQVLRHRLFDQCQECGLSSDVIFHLEDGTIAGHRPILMARCDMMRAMFSGDFRESNAKIVTFPGVKLRTFNILLQYLYKDSIPTLKIKECLPTVELANRLCLPVLVTLVESEIVDHFNRVIMAGGDVCDDCLHLLEPLQMHNADQLVDWCLTYLASSYNLVCHKYSKLLRSLHPENQAWLNRHRWPPVWYLKDFDYYERCLIERQRQDMPLKPLKRSRNTQGCLCFSSKNRRKADKQNYCTM